MTIPYADIFSSCPVSWEIVPLQEHVFFQEGPGILAKDFRSDGIPLLRLAGLGSKFATLDGCNFLDPELVAKKWSHFRLEKGDVVTSTSASFGRTSVIDDVAEGAVPYTGIIRFRPKSSKVNKNFIGLFLRSSYFEEQASSFAAGSVISHFGPTHLKQMAIALPPVDEQKAISAVISSLDDKIDLLHRQNKTLEAMAASLFRQWFVEEAQEDWEECTLDDVISVKGGTTPSTKEPEYWDGNIRWSTPRDLSNHDSVFLFDTERKITEKGLAQIGSGLLPVGTVLLSSRAPIGYLAISDIPVAINQGYIAIVCDKQVSNYFVFLWCLANMDEIKSAGNGSTFEEISKSNFKALPLNIPPKKRLTEFDKVIAPTFEKIKTNQKQIRTLETLRDTLLPKLMSGEVRVALDA